MSYPPECPAPAPSDPPRQAVLAGSRYTPKVSWKRSVSFVILALLIALPVSGAVCAMLCESAANGTAMASGHHHGATQSAEAPASPSSDFQISGVSEHDCSSHDGALREPSTIAAERADWGITSMPLVSATVVATFKVSTESGPRFSDSTVLGSASPTTTPLVLRV